MTCYPQLKDGQWQRITNQRHLIECCDCGLVHLLRFRGRNGKLEFSATRDNRKTGQVRRRRKEQDKS